MSLWSTHSSLLHSSSMLLNKHAHLTSWAGFAYVLETSLLHLSGCSGNAIDVSGAKALAAAIAANTTLSSLVLSDNYIGAEGAKALADALLENSSLSELAIKGNELGDEGVEALCTALQVRLASVLEQAAPGRARAL